MTKPETEHYQLADIIKCMRNSAVMLNIADNDRPNLQALNRKQAELLSAAADDLELQDAKAKR
jgi:hypothetical protein